MPLAPGVRLGPYEIVAAIGAGGMGEVYRAHDTKLDRDVAIKVLPDAFAADPERVARFQREAKTLASLNHPHIAAIYGLEDAAGVKALVLELVEGPTLADRIAQGPLPIDEALAIARQIGDALEAAHEQGIIHRDLKPANIKLRPDGAVKVLDFGLAKALTADSSRVSSVGLTNSPTITSPIAMSGVGVLLGTAAYMAPEQARGKPVDKRADIWAFGCVLYEMLTGLRPFEGEDVALTFAAIMKSEPDLHALPAALPPAVRSCIGRCLHKDPKQRLRDIGDVRLVLEGTFETATQPARVSPGARGEWRKTAAVSIIALVLGALTAGFAVWTASKRSEPQRPVRFVVNLPPSVQFRGGIGDPVTISADGRRVVFNARQGNVDRVYTRALDQIEAVPVRGLDGIVGSLFLSPDGEWIGFDDVTDATFKRIRASGGPAATICRTGVTGGGGFRGATWGTAGTIVFATAATPALMQVAEGGGEPKPVTTPGDGEIHVSPHFLPDGRRLLFTVRKKGAPDQIALLDRESASPRVLLQGTSARYAATGHVLFVREGAVWAAAFDVNRGAIAGDPAPVLEDVEILASGVARLGLANDGTLVYAPGSGAGTQRTLVWVDRSGREEAVAAPPRQYSWVRVSPDGTRLAMEIQDTANTDIWTYDLRRGTLDRLTFSAGPDRWPLWTPDGQRIVFASGTDLMWTPADGTGNPEKIAAGLPFPSRPYAWSRGKLSLVYDQENVSGDTFLLPLGGNRQPQPLIATDFRNHRPAISPDGRWIAYTSNETGREEIYVRPFPAVGSGRWAISSEGGISPVWAPNGRELFYNSIPINTMLRVAIDAAPSFRATTPEVLFQKSYFWGLAAGGRTYDMAPDGRFLMIKEGGTQDERPPSIVLVLNWFEELKRLVPSN
jgi:Tol biopolymer transport system component